ncbi:MAG: putative glycoside hydrolase, partial [Holosporales bacterium]|nr:putative glycoside hydrolase [Holosporales bacterium]
MQIIAKFFGVIWLILLCLFPASCDQSKNANDVRGIYVGASNKILSMIEIAKKLSANAMVIDIKNDLGEVTCDLGVGSQKKYISDIKGVIKYLKENGIYAIARIVAFKDPLSSETMPDLVIRNK